MSDKEANGDSNSSRNDSDKRERKGEGRSDVCRDYLNNICNRGHRCKFFHPEQDKPAHATGENDWNFCIDFQKKTGDVTLNLARAIAAMTRSDTINGIPICKEYQMGEGCSRGSSSCRYWHINVEEEKERRRVQMGSSARPSATAERYPLIPGARQGIRRRAPEYDYDDYPAPKRAYGLAPIEPATSSRYVMELERRNSELLSEVESLRRDLRRERDRYEDLVTLFRETAGAGSRSAHQAPREHHDMVAPVPPPAAHPAWASSADAKYDWYPQ